MHKPLAFSCQARGLTGTPAPAPGPAKPPVYFSGPGQSDCLNRISDALSTPPRLSLAGQTMGPTLASCQLPRENRPGGVAGSWGWAWPLAPRFFPVSKNPGMLGLSTQPRFTVGVNEALWRGGAPAGFPHCPTMCDSDWPQHTTRKVRSGAQTAPNLRASEQICMCAFELHPPPKGPANQGPGQARQPPQGSAAPQSSSHSSRGTAQKASRSLWQEVLAPQCLQAAPPPLLNQDPETRLPGSTQGPGVPREQT